MNPDNSIISDERRELAIRQRYSPFPELTMELLSQVQNQFRVGELRPAARIWEIMMERDGDLAVPAEKLFADIARLPYMIEREDESDEAHRHQEALQYFYTNLTATSVLEQSEVGGINLLLRQMMTAHAYRYSIHEIVLQISSASKKQITATFHHAPVWFFENRKGRLGFLKQDYAVYGEPLEPGQWLAAVGRGMMRQCSVAYLTKWQPMAYWLLFCYRFGVPGIHGKTDAAKDSPEWIAFGEALSTFANDWVTQSNRTNEISLIEAAKGGTGTLPFADLIERADRVFARSFRGGDLSTQSRAGGDVAGSNPQESEKQVVLEDGAQWATDTLNVRVDQPVIDYLFHATPKAWIRIKPPKRVETDSEVKKMEFLAKNGGRVAVKDAHDTLQVRLADAKEEILHVTSAPEPDPNSNPALGNADLAAAQLATAVAADLQPVLEAVNAELDAILTISDPALRLAKWNALWDRLAPLRKDILVVPAAAQVLGQLNARAFASGLQGNPPA